MSDSPQRNIAEVNAPVYPEGTFQNFQSIDAVLASWEPRFYTAQGKPLEDCQHWNFSCAPAPRCPGGVCEDCQIRWDAYDQVQDRWERSLEP